MSGTVEALKAELLGWIERDRDEILTFLADFIRVPTPNPPGDTVAATDFVAGFLDRQGLPYRLVSPQPSMPNLVATVEGEAGPGRHLVLNGHLDVFPVGAGLGWTRDPWGGEIADGRVWGRGACDMKGGTTASIFTFAYLARLRHVLPGRLTLTVVSDEETLGAWGSRYLVEHHGAEVLGDCCLNAEPSSLATLRFGEKGMLWLRFHVTTRGGHSAYPHTGESATKIAARLIGALEELTALRPDMPEAVARTIAESRPAIEAGLGAGATETMQALTTNVGSIAGGLKINMIPDGCTFEYDIRLPVGLTRERVVDEIAAILRSFPQARVEELNATAASVCDPEGEMVAILQGNAEALTGRRPSPIISLGGTDARFWRYAGVPAYVYGPSPASMGRPDEHIDIEEFFTVLRVHATSALDYLAGSLAP